MTHTMTEPHFAEARPYRPLITELETYPPEAGERWAREIESGIREDPYRYHYALVYLGTQATSQSTNLRTILFKPEVEDLVDVQAFLLITRYFSTRSDQGVQYDDQTEASLKLNTNYAVAFEAHRNAQPQSVSTGKMAKRDRPHPDAGRRSELVRSLRLELYIWQVIQWNAKQAQEPEAG